MTRARRQARPGSCLPAPGLRCTSHCGSPSCQQRAEPFLQCTVPCCAVSAASSRGTCLLVRYLSAWHAPASPIPSLCRPAGLAGLLSRRLLPPRNRCPPHSGHCRPLRVLCCSGGGDSGCALVWCCAVLLCQQCTPRSPGPQHAISNGRPTSPGATAWRLAQIMRFWRCWACALKVATAATCLQTHLLCPPQPTRLLFGSGCLLPQITAPRPLPPPQCPCAASPTAPPPSTRCCSSLPASTTTAPPLGVRLAEQRVAVLGLGGPPSPLP